MKTHRAPCRVAHAHKVLGRTHDIGEHHGRKNAVDVVYAPDAGQKLLHFIEQGFLIARPWHMVVTRHFHEASTGDLRRQPAPLLNFDVKVPVRCSTSVGTPIVGNTWRTSICVFILSSATAALGLAALRK